MTVKKKIISSTILLMALFIIAGAALILEYHYLSRKTAITNQLNKQSVYLQMLLRGLNELILNEGTQSSMDLTKRAVNGFDLIHSDLLVKAEATDMRKYLIEDVGPKWRDIKKGIVPFLENHYMDIHFNDDEVLRMYGSLITDTEDIIGGIEERAAYLNENIMQQTRKVRYGLVLTLLGMLALIGIHLYNLYKSITKPIDELLAVADGLHRGDLSMKMDETSKDEFGELARHFNNAIVKLYYLKQKGELNSEQLLASNIQLQAEIAERGRIEGHMIQAYSLTHEILERAPLGIYLCDSAGIVEYVNKAMLEISGETHEQFVGLDVYETPTYRKCGLSLKIRDAVNGVAFDMGPFEYTSYHGGKTSIRIMHGIPFEEEQEKKALIFVEDITELHKTREQLMYARNDWEDTFNTITDMITVHDTDFNIIGANEAARKMMKIPDLELHKKIKCYQRYHGTEFPPAGCLSCNCLKTAKSATFEIFEPHLNTHVEIRSIPRLDENNQLIGLIHVCRDISERKKDQELINTQLNRLGALRSIDRAILGSIDMRIMLDVFLDQIMRQLNADAVSVLLLNQTTQTLEHLYSKGFRSQALKRTKLRLGQSHAGRAAVDRHILCVPDLRENPDGFVNSREFGLEGFISYNAVPLRAKGEVKGVLEIFHRSRFEAGNDWLEFLEAIADQGAIAIDNATMFERLQRSNLDLSIAYDNTIEGWSRAMDLRDKETEGHSQRVMELTLRIAREMGIRDESLVNIRRGALLHDMGKLGIPDGILLKPGKLNDEEWVIMKKHPEYAYEMLYPIEHLRPALDIPYYHHEKWDGTGYPKGLKGEMIPLAARIFAVVDVWDALCYDRPYRLAWPKDKVLEHIRSLSGTHFDTKVLEVFFKINWEVNSGELTIVSDDPAIT